MTDLSRDFTRHADAEDLDPRIARAIRMAAEGALQGRPQRATTGVWVRWAIGLLVPILAAFGLLYARMSSLEQSVTDVKAEVEHIYRLVEPRYRGGDSQ